MAELRQIRTLRLAASRREHVARAAIALEDALRTASLPHLPRGAILLVRRLSLGRLTTHASPQWLSRHIETRLRALHPAPLRVRQDDRPDAPAVWFANRSEALAALVATSLRELPRAWYWPGVLPGWRPGMTVLELLPRALRAAEAEAQGAGVAALLDRLLRLERLEPVLRHLDPVHLAPSPGSTSAPGASAEAIAPGRQPAAEAQGETPGVAKTSPPSATEASASIIASDAWRVVLTRWVREWGAADRRSRWLAAHALIAVHGPAAAAHAEQLIAHLSAPTPMSRSDRIEADAPQPVQRPSQDSSHMPASDLKREGSRSETGDTGFPESQATSSAGPSTPDGAARTADMDASPPAEPDWQPSRHAGLLLLLPAIARLGIAEADPEGDLCLHLLHRIADRLRIRTDDAIRRALPKPLPRTEPWALVPPAVWQGLLHLPRHADLGREACPLAACQLVLARFLRRYAKISVRRLVHRPALVHATRTHIDLRFDARWVDLDLRLAGLDLDPGWVPWLGRVVSFHYDYEGQA